ncbi:MFS transporter, partial [Streptomyces sp. NPDC087850]
PEVLLPVFDRMVDEGYLSRTGNLLSHTEAGSREAALITRAWGHWLNERLDADRGRPSGAELRRAVDAIAKRLLAEDLAHDLSAGATVASGS